MVSDGEKAVQAIFANAEEVPTSEPAENEPRPPAQETQYCPIVPLGHKDGGYSFLSASSELRCMKAEKLEAGRGVRALFCGVSEKAEGWCVANFGNQDGKWSPKDVGDWIIKSCNTMGVFDKSNADLRSIGVWRDEKGKAIAHCGNMLVTNLGQPKGLLSGTGKHVMIGAAPIKPPAATAATNVEMSVLLEALRRSWGWKRNFDADIFFGWLSAAYLGGYPNWRSHLYVHGSRGSGKSKLMEFAAMLLGGLAGDVLNDATEAALRQSRNNEARPVLIDEFEPDDNARNGARQDAMFALFRRMSGGAGGRISRGGADHSAVTFRSLGAAYVTSINHISLEPQDRSRFVMLELDPLPHSDEPMHAIEELHRLECRARDLSPALFGRMLLLSERWDATHATIAAEARCRGADARQADTLATILAGRDLALHDSELCRDRICKISPIIDELLGDASETDAGSEGTEALDHLLCSVLQLDHGLRRPIGELIQHAISGEPMINVDDPTRALQRSGIYVSKDRHHVALPVGKTSPVAKLYNETKWRNGAHASAIMKLDGVIKPRSAVRVTPNVQIRVIQIPFSHLPG